MLGDKVTATINAGYFLRLAGDECDGEVQGDADERHAR